MDDPSGIPQMDALLAQADWLRSLARRLVADVNDADDVVQRTWLAAARHPPRRPEAARSWLGRVARRFAIDAGRTSTRRPASVAGPVRDESTPPSDEVVAQAEGHRELVDAILALREPYCRTILLRFFRGLSSAEIARQDGLPSATVRVRLNRGLALLRERLESRHGRRGAWSTLVVVAGSPSPPSSTGAATGVLVMTGKKMVSATVAIVTLIGLVVVMTGDDANDIKGDRGRPLASHASGEGVEQASGGSAIPTSRFSETQEEKGSAAGLGPVDDPEFGALLVRLKWHDGTPAVGVFACVFESSPKTSFRRRRMRRAADGTFAVRRVQPGHVSISIDRGGGESATVKAGKWTVVECTIPRGSDVEGRVVDDAGQPVAGASIWLSSYGNNTIGAVVSTTDGEGRFHLRSVSDGRCVAARAKHHAPSNTRGIGGVPGETEKVTLRLAGVGGAIRGTVLRPDDEPVSEAIVRVVSPQSGRVLHPETRAPPIVVETDEKGTFEVVGLPVGKIRIQVRAARFAPWEGDVEVRAEKTADITARLEDGATIVGTVRDGSGRPLPSTSVRVRRAGPFGADLFMESMTRAAEDGSFRLTELRPGRLTVRAALKSVGKVEATVEARGGQETTWNPVLDAGICIRGRVLDGDGAPIEGCLVNASDSEDEPNKSRGQSKTDSEGRFNITNCTEHPPVTLTVWLPREPGASRRAIGATRDAVKPGGPDVVFHVTRESRPVAVVRGRVLETDGEPVKAMIVVDDNTNDRRQIARTDPETGVFEITGVRPGRYRTSVRRSVLGRRELGVHELRAGQAVDLGDITLDPVGRLRVQLKGEPDVVAASVFVLSQKHAVTLGSITQMVGGPWDSRNIDPTEITKPQELGPGDYDLHVRGANIVPVHEKFTIRAGQETTVQIALVTGVAQRLRFVFPEGARVERVVWSLHDERGKLLRRAAAPVPDSGLPAATVRLRPGRYTVKGLTDRGARCDHPFVARATTPVVEVPMTPLWPTRGALVRFNFEFEGRGGGSSIVYYNLTSKRRRVGLGAVRKDSAGAFRDEGRLPPGSYRIVVNSYRVMGSVEFEVAPGETEKTVRVALSPRR